MNIFTIIFSQNFSKIFSKTHQIAPFEKIFSGSMPPDPPSKRVAKRHANTPTFTKNFEPPPPK